MTVAEIDPRLHDLPAGEDRAELMWCASIAAFVEWNGPGSMEQKMMGRAINTAVGIAVRELLLKQPKTDAEVIRWIPPAEETSTDAGGGR